MTRATAIFIVSLGALVFSIQTVEADAICSASSANLRCLEQHFDEFYAQDPDHFWEVLHKSADGVNQCRSVKKTAAFLCLVRIKTGNAEFDEFFAQTTENLCMSSLGCFKRASRLLDKEIQKNLAAMLDKPLFVDREDLHKAGCLDK